MKQYDRGYALIHLDALESNLNVIHNRIENDAKMIGVIKADGYGHGAVPIAKLMEERDDFWGYAVANPEEAMELKQNDCQKPILILGYSFPYAYDDLIRYQIRQAVFTVEVAKALSDAAVFAHTKAIVHVKVDCGMSRIGIRPDDVGVDIIRSIMAMPGIEVEGIFTHFSRADELDRTIVQEQFGAFKSFVERLEALGLHIPLKHCSNSASIMMIPEANMDMVRAGITIYGLMPSDEIAEHCSMLKPVMEWKTRVSYVKTVPEGTSVSYGGTYITDCEKRIATIPIGYADGYARGLSNKGYVLIHGHRFPIVGRICMDQFMVDVTEDETVVGGDAVTLIGFDGEECITMEEVGALSGRFNYEFACEISKRIPRLYERSGKIIAVKDYRSLTGISES